MNISPNELNQHYKINTFGVSSVEFFWGLGLPVVIESTFLQIFVRSMGANSVVIGVIPALLFLGQAFFGLFAAYGASGFTRKKPALILTHCIPSAAILFFGIFLLFFGFSPGVLGVFLISYALFSIGIGLILPVWQNYLVLIFTPEKSLSALSIMMITQSAGRIIGSFLIAKVVSELSFSANAGALVFISCGIIFLASSFIFLVTKEPVKENHKLPPKESLWQFIKSSIKDVIHNKNFLFFLGADLEMFAVITVLSFYANFATENIGIGAAMATGGFIGFNYGGQILANWLFGIKNHLSLKKKAYLSRIISIISIVFLVIYPSLPTFLIASVFLGVSRAIRSLIYPPVIKKISKSHDATHFFAVAPLITLPVSSGISILSGKYLDIFQQWGDWSYRSLFLILAMLIGVSFLFLKKSDF